MISNFRSISISHKKTSSKIRSKLYLSHNEQVKFYHLSKRTENLNEILIVSTCNRLEFYYSSKKDCTYEIIQTLLLIKENQLSYKEVTTTLVLNNETEACKHLLRVGAGIESQVLGDLQIINQLKKAYALCCENHCADVMIHKLMHNIFYNNKSIAQKTSFRDGTASTSYATYKLSKTLQKTFTNPKILIVGAGEIASQLCKYFPKETKITIINRTLEKAKKLSEIYGFKYSNLETIDTLISESQIIISTVEVKKALINKKNIPNGHYIKYFIDLSIPHSIDNSIDNMHGVELYNIDDLSKSISESVEKRKNDLPKIEEIIYDSLEELKSWNQETSFTSVVKELKTTIQKIQKEELTKLSHTLSAEEISKLTMLSDKIIDKIVSNPATQLVSACKRDSKEAENLSHALANLFNLELKQQTTK